MGDIRVVADRTAEYVAKNGRGFESRIVNSAKGKTPKFAFLQPTSPFHAYYEERIQQFENPVTVPPTSDDDDEKKKKKKKDDDDNDGTTKKGMNQAESTTNNDHQKKKKDGVAKQKASVMNPIAKAIFGQRLKITDHLKKEREKRRTAAAATTTTTTTLDDNEGDNKTKNNSNINNDDNNNNNNNDSNEEEEEEETTPALSLYNRISQDQTHKFLPLPPPPIPLETVCVVAPYHLTPTQLETIQLVAQFVALDGKGGSFFPALCAREWSNRTYDFCQPRHIQFTYFSALVDTYRTLLQEHLSFCSVVATTGEEEQKKRERTRPPHHHTTHEDDDDDEGDNDNDALQEKTTTEEKEKRGPVPPKPPPPPPPPPTGGGGGG